MKRALAAVTVAALTVLTGCSSSSSSDAKPSATPSTALPTTASTGKLAPKANRDAAAAVLRAITQHYRQLLAAGQAAWGTPAFGPWQKKTFTDVSYQDAAVAADKQFTADNEPASLSTWRDDTAAAADAINQWASKYSLETADKSNMPPATDVEKALAKADQDANDVANGK